MLERGTPAPDCFGNYERNDRACDGRLVLREAPCVFRDRCVGARLAREDGLLPEQDLVRSGRIAVNDLGAVVLDSIFKYQVRDGVALKRAPGPPRLLVASFLKAPSEKHARKRQALDRMVGRYFRRIALGAGVDLFGVRRECEHDSLYIDDFEGLYGYTRLGYCISGGVYRAVTRVWKRQYEAVKLTLDLPWTESVLVRDLSTEVMATLRVVNPPKSSALATRVANVGRIALDALSEMLAEDIRAGRFRGKRQDIKDRT